MNSLFTDKPATKERLYGFDVLRAIAVVLVLFNHSDLDNFLAKFGWLGVDLFFVLSGFLISGLLFQEYKSSGALRAKRFFIRRSLKILPPFYAFIIISVLYGVFLKQHTYSIDRILTEVFFLQNYLKGIWRHTWSLGVEEQFYLVLMFLLLVVVKLKVLNKPGVMLPLLCSFLAVSLAFKFQTVYAHRFAEEFFFVETHLRIEGVLFGVILSYMHHFTKGLDKLKDYSFYLMIAGVLLISPGFFIEGGSYVMNTLGLTMANLGFTLILLATFFIEKRKGISFNKKRGLLVRLISLIGVHSYSIYLWHLNAKELVKKLMPYEPVLSSILYIVAGIAVGIAMSFIIERPVLKWRNRHWQ